MASPCLSSLPARASPAAARRRHGDSGVSRHEQRAVRSCPALRFSSDSTVYGRLKRRCRASASSTTTETEPASSLRAVDSLDGVSFTPAGLLYPYYVGVGAALQDMELITDDTRLAGSSAGAIIAVFLASGLAPEVSMEAFRLLLADVTENGTIGRLGEVLRKMLQTYLPEDIAERASGRVTIGMTDFNGFESFPFSGVLVDEFHSKDDLIDAVCASCHIPYYLGPTVGSTFRGQELSDGAATVFLPPVCDDEGCYETPPMTIGVSAVAASSLGKDTFGRGVDISPDLQEKPAFGFFKLSRMGLLPCTPEEGERLYQLGYQDATTWVDTYEPDVQQAKELLAQQTQDTAGRKAP